MAVNVRTLAFVMAGGQGSRLFPLTETRCKPVMPFAGRHRLVDFVLSNLVNSGIQSNYVLVQYKAQSLIEHLRSAWTPGRSLPGQFVTAVPPQMRNGPEWYAGTADAVYQNLHLIESFRPDVVAIFGADHIYRMDVRQMIDFHLRHHADATVATLPVPLGQSDQFGIVEIDGNQRITGFREKPASCAPFPGSQTHALASMGNYIFNADVLRSALKAMHATGGNDFGKDVLPAMIADRKLLAYDFDTNRVPGTQPHEEHAYWRDVGTVDAYFQSSIDTLGATPRFDVSNAHWPIHAAPETAEPARVHEGAIHDSVLGAGSEVNGAELDHAVLRGAVRVEGGARLTRCLVMNRSRIGRGAHICRAIIDEDNDVPPGEQIGVHPEADRKRFHVTEGGIVVVPAHYFPTRAVTNDTVTDWRSAPGHQGVQLRAVA